MDKSLINLDKHGNHVDDLSHLYDKSQKNASKKLIIASILCTVFMIIEIIAAILSNSLSLMADASHLFCDLLSFGLNLFSIYVSNFEGNVDMSFGYHRAEIIGALFSIFFIWALSAYILYSAIFRLFNVKPVNGYIMFVTSFLSTIANIFIAYVLKVHSHGLGIMGGDHDCGHTKELHNHSEGKECNSHEKSKSNNKKVSDVISITNEGVSVTKNEKAIVIKQIATTNNGITNKNIINNTMDESSCNYITFDFYQNISKINNNNNKEQAVEDSLKQSLNNSYNNNCNADINCCKNKKGKKKKNGSCTNLSNGNTEINSNSYMVINETCEENFNYALYENPKTQQNSCHNHDINEISSISLKAAYLHAISDLIQNIGVMIASAIIWYNPQYSITDPICSIIFCFIVFSTTISVIKEILKILMEGTPASINLIDIKNDLLKISGVMEVHDLHAWSLSIGKPALACHIVTHKDNSHNVLKYATLLCQHKYKILHTTVQTDYPSNISSCETYAHLKCSNLETYA